MDLETLHTYEPFLLGFILILVFGFLVKYGVESTNRCWACDCGMRKEGNKHISESGFEYECFNEDRG